MNDRKVLIIAENKILELLKKWFFEENNLIAQTAVFSNLFPLKKIEEAEIIFIFVPFTQNMNYLEFFMYTNLKLHSAYKDKKIEIEFDFYKGKNQ